ncbi:MAG: 6-carboxytetrahydropterin synthase QueD [Bacteroidetes bacterium]|nr:MAG: 6-carboxytetrahydropterin synthase QueD [Bacteroidota bacterium]
MSLKSYIRITKEFKFETAHSLPGYDGLCKNIHGHSYELLVTVAGYPLEEKDHPKLGMVMDFGDLKKIVRKEIVEPFDHALVLRSDVSKTLVAELKKNYEKIILLNYQPTSEMMLIDFAERLKAKLPENIDLKYLMLRETVTSYAEWFADEN